MNKNKLLRVMMLLSLLAPTAGSVTVLAQDALPEVNQATATSTDDVTSTDSDSQKEKDPNVTTEDQTNHVSSDDTSAKSDVLNPAEPTRPELEDQTDQVTTPNATIPGQDQGQDKSPSSQEPSKTPQGNPVPVSPAPQVPAAVTPLPWSPFASDLNLEIPILPSVNTYAAYVEHWSGKDAYTHNLLSRRYGIKAEQIDGYLKSTGISYDKTRINGEKLLQWEKKVD